MDGDSNFKDSKNSNSLYGLIKETDKTVCVNSYVNRSNSNNNNFVDLKYVDIKILIKIIVQV
jgi:hypothetical protein